MAEMIANTLFLFVLVGTVAGLGRMARLLAKDEQATTLTGRGGEYDLGRDLAAGLELLLSAGRARAERLDHQMREMNQAGDAARA